MKRIIVLLSVLACFCSVDALAQMSDQQVIEFVQQGVAQGKSKTRISNELLAKGITREQVERIRADYESSASSSSNIAANVAENTVRARTRSAAEITNEQSGVNDTQSSPEVQNLQLHSESAIYGHEIFNSRALSFEPNTNVATPENYVLGPGDAIQVDIWGYNEASQTYTISPEGRIFISQVGPVQLSGLSIKEADKKIKKLLAAKYSGLEGDASNASVSLAQIRSIQVNIMGEVNTPGTYRISAFSTVFHALYRAGGISSRGTLRNIELLRSGKKVASIDLYTYIFNGDSSCDLKLQEGDVIMVPPYKTIASIDGKIKRPMRYELVEGEHLGTLIQYAGGFESDAYTEKIDLIRVNGKEHELHTVKHEDIENYVLQDGDAVSVSPVLDRFANVVEVRGYVFRPGRFQLGGEIATVRQLVESAEGPTEDAFLDRAIILREKDNLAVETISLDLGGILSGSREDILLRKNDVLIVSGIYEINNRGTINVDGFVAKPGTYPYAENTTIEDIILQAGGFADGASFAKIDVSRRNLDQSRLNSVDTLTIVYTFAIEDGFMVDKAKHFVLEPYDVVTVRATPGFYKRTSVEILGEVTFPGTYMLEKRGERLSEVIKRAGGISNFAYPAGARLMRQNDADYGSSVRRLAANGQRDSIGVSIREVSESFLVSLDLEKAIANPGSEYDIVLFNGDRIFVPEYNNTIRVFGAVMFPNAVSYVPGKNLQYYIHSAGGYSENAKRSRAYIVYANGAAATSRLGNAKIEPGCLIIVPEKNKKEKVSVGEIAAVTSAASSMTSVLAILTNIFLR